MKILAIDDSEFTLDLIRDTLSMHSHEVQTASNGADGIRKFREFRPDLVTLDLAMPEMDGYAVLKKILEIDRNAVVVTITAVWSKEMMERSTQLGAVKCMSKPFSPSELVRVVKEIESRISARRLAQGL